MRERYPSEPTRLLFQVHGTVQGIGFRPFVYRIARANGLTGFVFNHDQGVTLEVQGPAASLDAFARQLVQDAPAAAHIEDVSRLTIALVPDEAGFMIRESPPASSDKFVPISPDLATCPDCLRELFDPDNRRYLYPFINCTNCGPRFTIIRDVPYDRPKTTMAPFALCPNCRREYEDPSDRRFHAQPNACPDCGPRLELVDRAGGVLGDSRDARALFELAAKRLRSGQILALKGIGGFHLACDARNENAVRTLRERKLRELRPFAVMFPSLAAARQCADIGPEEAECLQSSAHPIGLVRKVVRGGDSSLLAESVAPRNAWLGVFLPYSPLHAILLHFFDGPLVLTSGNLSDEPIVTDNKTARERLAAIADVLLVHNRDIHIRCDDSVVQFHEHRPFVIRRSRGYAPAPISLQTPVDQPVLGVGGHLKNTFCLARGQHALVSHHLGDLENLSTLESFSSGIRHFSHLFNAEPQAIAHDLHPEYLSTQWAREEAATLKVPLIPVQHHHAHIASCMEENGVTDAVLGLALDGTGYGQDGTIWGGEFLIADRRDFVRVGRLGLARIPGGDQATRHPWRLALAYLHDAFANSREEAPELAALTGVPAADRAVVLSMLQKDLRCVRTSSCGRLFDAVSALAGLTLEARYDGQPAIELEGALTEQDLRSDLAPYPFGSVENGPLLEIDWRPALRAIARDVAAGTSAAQVSAKFHLGLSKVLVASVARLRDRFKIETVALAGGCLMNQTLRTDLQQRLKTLGFRVLFNQKLPTNDGGISFGQVVVANQVLRGVRSCVWQYR